MVYDAVLIFYAISVLSEICDTLPCGRSTKLRKSQVTRKSNLLPVHSNERLNFLLGSIVLHGIDRGLKVTALFSDVYQYHYNYYSCQIILNLSLYSLYVAEACNEFTEFISASLRPGNTASLKKCSSDVDPLFEPQTSHFRDEPITVRTAHEQEQAI